MDVTEELKQLWNWRKESRRGRGGCDQRIEVIVKMRKKSGGSGWMCTKNRVNVNEE